MPSSRELQVALKALLEECRIMLPSTPAPLAGGPSMSAQVKSLKDWTRWDLEDEVKVEEPREKWMGVDVWPQVSTRPQVDAWIGQRWVSRSCPSDAEWFHQQYNKLISTKAEPVEAHRVTALDEPIIGLPCDHPKKDDSVSVYRPVGWHTIVEANALGHIEELIQIFIVFPGADAADGVAPLAMARVLTRFRVGTLLQHAEQCNACAVREALASGALAVVDPVEGPTAQRPLINALLGLGGEAESESESRKLLSLQPTSEATALTRSHKAFVEAKWVASLAAEDSALAYQLILLTARQYPDVQGVAPASIAGLLAAQLEYLAPTTPRPRHNQVKALRAMLRTVKRLTDCVIDGLSVEQIRELALACSNTIPLVGRKAVLDTIADHAGCMCLYAHPHTIDCQSVAPAVNAFAEVYGEAYLDWKCSVCLLAALDQVPAISAQVHEKIVEESSDKRNIPGPGQCDSLALHQHLFPTRCEWNTARPHTPPEGIVPKLTPLPFALHYLIDNLAERINGNQPFPTPRALFFANDILIQGRTQNKIQESLALLETWLVENGMEANIAKCGVTGVKEGFPHTGKGIDWENHLSQSTEKTLRSLWFLERVGIAWPSWVRSTFHETGATSCKKYTTEAWPGCTRYPQSPEKKRPYFHVLQSISGMGSAMDRFETLAFRFCFHLNKAHRDNPAILMLVQERQFQWPITAPSHILPKFKSHPWWRDYVNQPRVWGRQQPLSEFLVERRLQPLVKYTLCSYVLPSCRARSGVDKFIFFPDPNVVSWAVKWRLNTFGIGKRCPECRQPINRAHVFYCDLPSNNINLNEGDFEAKAEEARANRIDTHSTILDSLLN
ncbi:uncharacterized protein VTP21DRAFT_7460 [Calcarisporiella thermophila]|uniref:uncharacterized protein n=1 Tax=Calcarisporiella thermophila TaxID=911321 RepID=UPI0037446CEC